MAQEVPVPVRMLSSDLLADAARLSRTYGMDAAWPVIAAANLLLVGRCGPHAPARATVHVGGVSMTLPVPFQGGRPDRMIAELVATWRAGGTTTPDAPAGLRWPSPATDPVTSDLTLSFERPSEPSWRVGGGWAGSGLVEQLPGCFETVLRAILNAPEQPVDELPVLDAAQLAWLTQTGRPADTGTIQGLVHQLVERQAVIRPDDLAFTCASATLTHRELNARANQLARVLRVAGARRERTVALLMDRSSEMLIAFLAVFKSGAAAILLDPAYPSRRIAEVLEFAEPVAVLTLARVGAVIAETSATVIAVDTEWPRIHQLDPSNLDIDVHPQDVAYVVHTSGSTGRPKRVAVVHESVAHSIGTHQAGHRIDSSDRASWLAPPGSSVSVGELWPYLSAGASVHAAQHDTVSSAATLRDWLVNQRITKAFVSMPLAEQLFTLPWPDQASLRLLTVGSDKVRRWASADLPFEVAVSYGSSEANGISSCLLPWEGRLTSATATAEDRRRPPPIGRVWPGVRVELLDDSMRRVPPGAVAELYVGGPELARGYLGDPGQTAQRFVPDPFGAVGGRLYRTGDLAYLDPRGLLHHCGRVDRELKIRGFRVDPGEVEAALLSHDGVREAVVVALADRSGDKQLCAYLVAPDVDVHSVRATVAGVLPTHAVPASFTVLDTMPATTNGKIDRSGLPEPDWDALRQPYRAPRDDLERQLTAIWQELLPVADIGVDDHFFHLGGDSMSASRLATRISSRLRVRVTLRAILEHATLGELATYIRGVRGRAMPARQ